MPQSPKLDQIISIGRAHFSSKQQMMYDEIISPYIQIISNLAGKLEELQKENTLLKSERKAAKTKKGRKTMNNAAPKR